MKKILLLFLLMTTFTYGQESIVTLLEIADGFTKPLDIQNAGDSRLFIVEQDGVIKILNNGTTNPTPFLTLNVNSTDNEQGLLGLAFHPDYVNNGFFFVNYTLGNNSTQISRFEVSGDPDVADANSEVRILNVPQPFTNHNGGCLQFGPDGYLYIGLGDGGSGGDPGNRAQDKGQLLGKMLRIDIDDTDSGLEYAIPDDNPFIDDAGARDEIWATGIRNPWKFSFDAVTGELWIADVGQQVIEEINKADNGVGGQNYGWRCYEGNSIFNTSNCPDMSELTFPLTQYTHEDDGLFKCSVTGGYVYRGSAWPNLVGTYIFADFCSNEIGEVDSAGNIVYTEPFPGGLSSFGEDENNELYVAALNSGKIYQIQDATLSLDELKTVTFKMYPNPASKRVIVQVDAFLPTGQAGVKAQTIYIYDLQGRLVKQSNIDQQTISFSVAELPAGIYLAQIDRDGNTQKLIVQ